MNSEKIQSVYQQESKSLVELYSPIGDELRQLDIFIAQKINSNVKIISNASKYLLQAGGKRIRPVILIAIAKMLGANINHAITLGAVIEFIHSATLLHDDVVDASNTRRGIDTVNQIYGNAVSVLVGDFMYSRAFQIMAELESPLITKILSNATNTIAEGEVIQLSNIGNFELSREEYLQTIFCKTAKLFEAAGEIAVVIAENKNNINLKHCENAAGFGRHLGYAFQLTDDALDYCADPNNSGKALCKDLQESKITLPILLAFEQMENPQKLKSAIINKDTDYINLAIQAINKTKSVEQTLALAKEEIKKAKNYLAQVPDKYSPTAKQLLNQICDFVLERIF